ncbi:hypothetical protein [Salinispora vitiensis]|nr:hypothetical protein [Salinispora vitiensis]
MMIDHVIIAVMANVKPGKPLNFADIPVANVEWNARNYWPNEVGNLTPWVIQHLDDIGHVLGMRLEAQTLRREVRLGSFRADLVLEDSQGRTVLMELQFGPSDHEHLAKVVTYASESSADAIVWIVAGTGGRIRPNNPIRPEHQRILAWLNREIRQSATFYGLSIELESEPSKMPHADLPLLPRLKLVVGPEGSAVGPERVVPPGG